ncbi:MAG: aminomethyl-transferring glycine dehydrogenase subunit GcvPA [Deltaproteobacteria bacterium]|nr:aminomethyl-transferring glycine dehydrogenase subunit GcvPA [Deltaproteobacteria bacterium]
MRYLPHTPDDVREMLAVVGVSSLDELFGPIPESLRMVRPLDLPEALPECRLRFEMEKLAGTNLDAGSMACFAGAGIYNHYVPAAVGQLLVRSELYTAYTPYQPEVSQGTLQAVFEYQTMMARYLAMEVSNASLYDGSTATAEAVGMALRIHRNKRPVVVIAGHVHPEYLGVVRSYLTSPDETIRRVPAGDDGRVDPGALREAMGPDVAAIVVQHPNFLGLLEDLAVLRDAATRHEALLVTTFSEALAFGLLKPPGAFGADIVVGEGQSFGMPVSYGGPLLGILTTRKTHVRSMPGRVVGLTSDRHGNDAYCVTLSTREQHIRREKATSNICTNEGLCAMSAAIYLSLLGNDGIAKLARLNHHASLHLARRLAAIPGVSLPYAGSAWFNEFAVDLPLPAAEVCRRMAPKGILAGVPLSRFFPEQDRRMLVAATELCSGSEIDRYVEALGAACA